MTVILTSFSNSSQLCNVTLTFWAYETEWFDITVEKSIIVPNRSTPKNGQWKVKGISESYEIMNNGLIHVHFTFEFQRHYQYFGVYIFAPGLILSILQLTSFFLPPNSPDRSMYCITIMLSLFVLKNETLSFLPTTSQPIYVGYYTLGEVIFSSLITSYASVICWFSNTRFCTGKSNQYNVRTGQQRPISNYISHIDQFCFGLTTAFLLSLNLTIAYLIGLFDF